MEVSDDGVGLPKPFAESMDADSSSLGLTLVRILVEQLGGTQEVTSAQGTAYRIEFPDAVKAVGKG
jgi:two-component sensor histidine kinase